MNERIEELLIDWEQARENGTAVSAEELCRESPELLPELNAVIAELEATDWLYRDDADATVALDADCDESPVEVWRGIDPQLLKERCINSDLLSAEEFEELRETVAKGDSSTIVRRGLESGKITPYQARKLASGEPIRLRLGEYLLLDELGEGGMGQVYRALHTRMNRVVALKVLPPETLHSKDAVRRFQREVEAAACLDHPNIVTAYDAGEHEGRHFLVMQCVDGSDLETKVRHSGPMSVDAALDVIQQVARGLDYAHRNGVVHRDVKPSNIMLDEDGVAHILDLGLARLVRENKTDGVDSIATLTNAGVVMGTMAYMSPEQGEDSSAADERSDIYSLGCTLFYLLAGRPPYETKSVVKSILAHREAPVPSVRELRSDVPAELDELFGKLVAKDPRDRPPSMQAVLHAIAIATNEVDARSRQRPGMTKRHWTAVGSLALVTAVVLLLVWPAPWAASIRSGAGHAGQVASQSGSGRTAKETAKSQVTSHTPATLASVDLTSEDGWHVVTYDGEHVNVPLVPQAQGSRSACLSLGEQRGTTMILDVADRTLVPAHTRYLAFSLVARMFSIDDRVPAPTVVLRCHEGVYRFEPNKLQLANSEWHRLVIALDGGDASWIRQVSDAPNLAGLERIEFHHSGWGGTIEHAYYADIELLGERPLAARDDPRAEWWPTAGNEVSMYYSHTATVGFKEVRTRGLHKNKLDKPLPNLAFDVPSIPPSGDLVTVKRWRALWPGGQPAQFSIQDSGLGHLSPRLATAPRTKETPEGEQVEAPTLVFDARDLDLDARQMQYFAFSAWSRIDLPERAVRELWRPAVVFRCEKGSYRFELRKAAFDKFWRRLVIPLNGETSAWTRRVEGSPQLSQLEQIEIHHGGWPMLYADMRLLNAPPVSAEHDPRSQLGVFYEESPGRQRLRMEFHWEFGGGETQLQSFEINEPLPNLQFKQISPP